MPKYRVEATDERWLAAEIEAPDENTAWDIALALDYDLFTGEDGEWRITHVEELKDEEIPA